ncbi:hypothetical protein QWY16_07125 [Planococcus shenhongbingii]|uniref:Uncharacterized protein n=1 Tax=Planococcus shenhongbingii TaxID=3058398 RepID=A0ABT8NDN4_9BACL|nr:MULTISPECIES: hypothetical protein [unclassified Planococcus (in: firmicutes)]MDN7245995.1 hypothetical protein [Planococcus sp. N017]WKA59875.1 hypothetical protein QWY16_07125 [Planococcus sp. N016]
MFEFVFRILGNAVLFKAGDKLQNVLLSPSNFEKNVERLNEEDWFAAIRQDFRYDHIIRYNSKVRKFLGDTKNTMQLLEYTEEQEKFRDFVHQEYTKLMKKK